jgi:hypothetical protein
VGWREWQGERAREGKGRSPPFWGIERYFWEESRSLRSFVWHFGIIFAELTYGAV